MAERMKILFLCTGNSCRSQMAEAWTNHLRKDTFKAYSAGIAPKGVDPRAAKVMAEAGVDISEHSSKGVDSLGDMEFDYVITLCDNANEACPFFPAKTKLMHRDFDDPPRLAEKAQDDESVLNYYRRVRDEIKAFVENMEEEIRK